MLTESRQYPDQPCTAVLSQAECQTLEAIAEKRDCRACRGQPPSVGEAGAIDWKLGGHLGRKCDGPPGIKTLWRGITRLTDLTIGRLLAQPP